MNRQVVKRFLFGLVLASVALAFNQAWAVKTGTAERMHQAVGGGYTAASNPSIGEVNSAGWSNDRSVLPNAVGSSKAETPGVDPLPVPASILLLGSGIVGLIGIVRGRSG